MYRYEELDYNQIMNDSAIDPNSAEAYYALAQCFRLGKGIAPSMDMYEDYLSYAAEEGHEEAVKELEALQAKDMTQNTASVVGPQVSEIPGTNGSNAPIPETDYASMSVSELRRMADAGSAEAAFRLYTVSKEIGDNKNAVTFLKRAGEYAAQNGVDKKVGQKIFWNLGELYKQGTEKNLQESIQAYEMAAELGSSQACTYLSECYRSGNGGVKGKDPEQAERYRRKAARNGSVSDRYRLAVIYMNENENLSAMELLEQVMAEVTPADDFYLLSRIQLSRMNDKVYPREELVERLWVAANQTNNQKLAKEAKAELLTLYKEGPARRDLSEALHSALTPERAYLLGTWRKNTDPANAKKWFAWASVGYAEAKTALAELIAEEEERQRQKALEEEKKKAEMAELAERKRREAAEKEERKKKEAAEKAERDRLAAIEAEKRRAEMEEQARKDRIEAEARALVLKEEREKERQRQKELAAEKAAQERVRREQEQIRIAQEQERQRRLAEANLRLQEQYCIEEAKRYRGPFVKYLFIAIVTVVIGFFAALISLSETSATHTFCEWFGTVGTLIWCCLTYRMKCCVSALEDCYPGVNNKKTIRKHLSAQRTLMWPIGLLWIINGMIAVDISWIGFFAGALWMMVQAAVICWIVNRLWDRFFLNDIFDWIRCKGEITPRRGEVLNTINTRFY